MKTTTYLLLAATVFVVVFASACSTSATPTTQVVPPPVEIQPTNAAPAEIVPTQPLATVQSFAPVCQVVASCVTPAVQDIPADKTYCVQKIPYQNIMVDEGVTVEVLDPSKLVCVDNGTIVDGKHVIECHGAPLWTSEVKLTKTACGSTNLVAGASQCQPGLGYDAAQNCCAPLTATDSGSVTIQVNLGACP